MDNDYCVYSLEFAPRHSWELVIVREADVAQLVKCVEAAGLYPRLLAHSQTHEGARGMAEIMEAGNFDHIRETPGVH